MFSLFATPEWFNGIDLIFNIVVLLIALFIAGYSWRVYKISKENKFAYFSFAFVLIGLAFLAKVVTFANLYFRPVRETVYQVLLPVTHGQVVFMDLFYRLGFITQMACMLGALLLIFLVSQKSRQRLHRFHEISQIGLFVYLIGLISILATFKYFVFPLTSAVLLSLIVLNYYKNYLNSNKNKNSYYVMVAFLLLLLSQLFFIFVHINNGAYFFAEVFLLMGFLLILKVYGKVTRRKN
jgi:hypothetical protein